MAVFLRKMLREFEKHLICNKSVKLNAFLEEEFSVNDLIDFRYQSMNENYLDGNYEYSFPFRIYASG